MKQTITFHWDPDAEQCLVPNAATRALFERWQVSGFIGGGLVDLLDLMDDLGEYIDDVRAGHPEGRSPTTRQNDEYIALCQLKALSKLNRKGRKRLKEIECSIRRGLFEPIPGHEPRSDAIAELCS